MLWRIWLVIATAAFVLTLAWLFVDKRTFLTTAVAGGLWSYLSLTVGNLQLRSLEAATVVDLEVPGLQWLCLGMALFSFLAFVLHYFGSYPPRQDELAETAPR